LEFHEAFGLPIGSEPTLEVPLSLLKLRHELLIEELRELVAAIDADDVVTVADALGDMVYVLYGTAVTFGINLDAVVAAIHLSNMSKIGPEGRPIMRPDGKVLKGPGYSPPAIAEALKAPRT
jgi:predicted HAD superfamily Cof-like phosphohydrolase